MTVFIPPNGAPIGPPSDAQFSSGDLWTPNFRLRNNGTAWVAAPRGTVTALVAASGPQIDPTLGDVFTVTPGEAENISATSQIAGQTLALMVTTSGSTSYTLTFNTGSFKSSGTLATGTASGKVFTVTFLSDGTKYTELARTAAL